MIYTNYPLAEKIYNQHLKTFERLRLRRWVDLAGVAVFGLIITAFNFVIICSYVLKYPSSDFSFWALLFVTMILSFIFEYELLNFNYRRYVKKKLLGDIARNFGFVYKDGGVMRLGDLYDHNLLPPYTTRVVEEGFHGEIDGFNIEIQDFTIQSVMRLGRFDLRALFGGSSFYGLAMRIKLNKTLKHHTIMMPTMFAHGKMRKYLNVKFREFDEVNLVFRKFKRRYTILSENQVESRAIFDPAMIERMLEFGKKLGSSWLEVSFKEREMVIIAGQSRNFFEPGTLLNPPSVLTIEQVMDQLAALKEIIEILELNIYTGIGAFKPESSDRMQPLPD